MEWAFLDLDEKPNTAFLGSLCWEEVGGIEKLYRIACVHSKKGKERGISNKGE